MRPVVVLSLLFIAAAVYLPSTTFAQQPRTRSTGERMRRAEQRSANETFQILGFNFTTGGDDLRSDSFVSAKLTLPDGTTQDCPIHGDTGGAGANLTWDNNSVHDAPPCHLEKSRTLAELKQSRIEVGFIHGGNISNFGLNNMDNWNINRVMITAYNQGDPRRVCAFNVGGNPLARLTGDQTQVTISDFPNQCR